MKVLIVDDSPPVRKIIGKMLRDFRLEFLEAENGKEALKVLNQHPDIQLVLLDWHMPKMDGIEFLKSIEGKKKEQNFKVIMVTTENTESHIENAMEEGADEYIMKPFTREILEEKLSLMGFGGEIHV